MTSPAPGIDRVRWQPSPVFLPGEFRGQGSQAGYNPWSSKESDMTETKTMLHERF